MRKQEFAWRRAERLLEQMGGEFDAAALATAARSSGWNITARRAKALLLELKSYGLAIRIRPHVFRLNRAAPASIFD